MVLGTFSVFVIVVDEDNKKNMTWGTHSGDCEELELPVPKAM
jgi:hypothetical protein